MATSYRIDKENGVVYSSASGIATDEEFLSHQRLLSRDPDFRPDYRQLLDGRGITELRVTPEGIRALIAGNPWGKGARRALVAADDTAFGMARMYELGRPDPVDEFRVFRSIADAREWLGLPPEPQDDQPD